jgi:adenylyltransferase/sulfurtransferase
MIRKLASKLLGKLRGSAPAAPAAPVARPAAPKVAEPVAEAESLARIEAGAQEVKERIDAGEPVVLLDVRTPGETAGGIIPGAILIPLDELEARWVEIKDKHEIVCYCAAGMRSLRAATMLRERGVFNATSLEGGVGAWKQLGGQLKPPPRA